MRPLRQLRLPRSLAERFDRLPRGWKRNLARGAAVAVVMAVGLGVFETVGGDGDRGDGQAVEATVRTFFEARSGGDCDRLVELTSEESWSQSGTVDRDEFLADCDAAVDAYGPDLVDVTVAGVAHGEAFVSVAVADSHEPREGVLVSDNTESRRTANASGTLVREGGDWKVELDQSFFRLGASPTDVLRSYYLARAERRCDDAVDLLTDDAVTSSGAADRAAFVARCRDAERVDPTSLDSLRTVHFDITDDDGRLTAAGVIPVDTTPMTETVTLVGEGLGWKLDRDLLTFTARDLRRRVVSPPEGYEAEHEGNLVLPHQLDWGIPFDIERVEGSDATARRADAGFEQGVVTTFQGGQGDSGITVLLYQFADEDGARAYGEHLVGRFAVPLSDDAPRVPARLPYRGVYICAGEDGCSRATEVKALDVHGRYVVGVLAQDWGEPSPTADALLDRATTVLDSQVAELP